MKYEYINTKERFRETIKAISSSPWLALDLEFPQFTTAIALIQLAWEGGAAIIDPLKIRHLKPLLELIEFPGIIKLVHSGMNDFSMLFKLHHCCPRNIFDTQVAAAFLDFTYPAALGSLVKEELGIQMEKGLAVSDWMQRPLSRKQLDYAIADVEYLHPLYKSFTARLAGRPQEEWLREEMVEQERMEVDEEEELLKHCLFVDKLHHTKKEVFFFRLLNWRNKMRPKNPHDFLPNKQLYEIVRIITGGRQAIEQNYKLKKYIRTEHCGKILGLWENSPTSQEKAKLKALPRPRELDTNLSILGTFLFSYIQFVGGEKKINYRILGAKKDIDNLLQFGDRFPNKLFSGWRSRLLGDNFRQWITYNGPLGIKMNEDSLVIRMKETPGTPS